jgi:hypothetical protein
MTFWAIARTRPVSLLQTQPSTSDNQNMSQHPRVTIGWAVAGLETAITKLGHGPAERRVRDQFHQLLLALERARLPVDLEASSQPEERVTVRK